MSDTAFRRRNKRCVPKRLISLLALLAFSLTGLLPLELSLRSKKDIEISGPETDHRIRSSERGQTSFFVDGDRYGRRNVVEEWGFLGLVGNGPRRSDWLAAIRGFEPRNAEFRSGL